MTQGPCTIRACLKGELAVGARTDHAACWGLLQTGDHLKPGITPNWDPPETQVTQNCVYPIKRYVSE